MTKFKIFTAALLIIFNTPLLATDRGNQSSPLEKVHFLKKSTAKSIKWKYYPDLVILNIKKENTKIIRDQLIHDFKQVHLKEVKYLENIFMMISSYDLNYLFNLYLNSKFDSGDCFYQINNEKYIACNKSSLSFFIGYHLFASDYFKKNEAVVHAALEFGFDSLPIIKE